MAKKSLSIWLLSSMTFISLIHFIDAFLAVVFNNEIRVLQIYPLINEKLQMITPVTYLWITAAASFLLWGMTCVIAFSNPVETFLNKVLSDAKTQGAIETQLLEQKSEILDMMNETIESNSEILAHVKDVIYNIRTEIKEIQPIKESVEKMKTELGALKREIKKFEDKTHFPNICTTCGKPLLPEFKMCPYCGEYIKLQPENMILMKEYR